MKGCGPSAGSRQRAPLARQLPAVGSNRRQPRAITEFRAGEDREPPATDTLGKFQCQEARLSWRNRADYEEEHEAA